MPLLAAPPTTYQRHHPRRRLAYTATLALAVAATAVAVSAASPAYAATATITCTGTTTIIYNPGLLLTSRAVTYTETDTFSSCTSTDPTLTSGSSTAGGAGDASCVAVPGVGADPAYVVHWNNGQSSTFNLTVTDAIVAGTEVVTGTGTVTAGALLGGTAVFTWIYPALNPLLCLAGPGITAKNGTLAAAVVLL